MGAGVEGIQTDSLFCLLLYANGESSSSTFLPSMNRLSVNVSNLVVAGCVTQKRLTCKCNDPQQSSRNLLGWAVSQSWAAARLKGLTSARLKGLISQVLTWTLACRCPPERRRSPRTARPWRGCAAQSSGTWGGRCPERAASPRGSRPALERSGSAAAPALTSWWTEPGQHQSGMKILFSNTVFFFLSLSLSLSPFCITQCKR